MPSSETGVFHMNEAEKLADKAKDPEEELIEALTEKTLEKLVEKGELLPFTDADGSTKYKMSSKFNRLATANYRRRN